MQIYLVHLAYRTVDDDVQTGVPLATLDLHQAIDIAKNIHTLGFPCDHGGLIGVYKMQEGSILTARILDQDHRLPSNPLIFSRRRERWDEDWVEEWLNQEEKGRYEAVKKMSHKSA